MATAKTIRRYETIADQNGLISVPVDVCRSDGSVLERRDFHISTATPGCSMTAADLQVLGYDASEPVTLPFIRIGMYDFFKIHVEVSDANVIGAGLLKWLNFSLSNSEGSFDVDLIDRLKPLVEKGVNPNIKSGVLSRVKSSQYNDNENWLTWEEIDARYPNSWVLLADISEDEETSLGGEVLWHSESGRPDTSHEDTLVYCNKSAADKKPFMVNFEDYVRCRGFAKPDQAFTVFVEAFESTLPPSKANRFYYDPVSKQGRHFALRKSFHSGDNVDPNAVLTQDAIDALFAEYEVE